MAECAQEIIIQNGFEQKIKLIKKRSTEVTVGLKGMLVSRIGLRG